MRVTVLCVLLCVAGCKKSPSSGNDAGLIAADAGGLKGPSAMLTAPSTLSVFEPAGDGCAWAQHDPVAKASRAITTFPVGCKGVRVAYSPDATRAVVWFDPHHVQTAGFASGTSSAPAYPDETEDAQATPRLFWVDVRAQRLEPLPFPELAGAVLQDVGVDGLGHAVALFEERIADADVERGVVTSNGKTFDLKEINEGLPVLVHASRREGAAWTRFETKLSTTGWDYARGVQELDAWSLIGAHSAELASAFVDGDALEGAAVAPLMKLLPAGTSADDGQWVSVQAGGDAVQVWQVTGEFAYATGVVVHGGARLPELGFNDGQLVAVHASGPFVLVTAVSVGTHPRLYRLPEAALVYRSDAARAVTFWPSTLQPQPKKAQ